ncbi:MAG TPA: STAS domain-containing protein, partial [Solirubrobacter sp.]|nr:STAS domain-containing protein [Solirubrobacter sp.]
SRGGTVDAGTMTDGLQLEREHDGAHVVLTLRGEIDMTTIAVLSHALDDAATTAGDVWVDLTAVEFMDSTGLNTLARAHSVLAGDARRLVVMCPGKGAVRRALEVSGLDGVLTLVTSRGAVA